MSNRQAETGHQQPVWLTLLVVVMRLVVGATFLFSGVVKAFDPWGTYYKVSEYLLTLGWDQLVGLSILFAFALPAFEMMVGVVLAVGAFRRGGPVAALVLMAVMLPLSVWLAVTNAVPDCGCFGDALHLSNTATLGKNVLLTSGCVFLLVYGRHTRGWYGPAVQWVVLLLTFTLAMLWATFGYIDQPLVDFRPFPVGTRVSALSHAVDDDSYRFIYERDGERREFGIDSVPDEEDGWTFVARRELPPPADTAAAGTRTISIVDQTGDRTDDVLDNAKLLLLLFPDLESISAAHSYPLNELSDAAKEQGVAVFGLTGASYGQIAEWADLSMADYPMLVADNSEIKMIARGNPAVVYLSNDTIVWKRTLTSIDEEKIQNQPIERMGDDLNKSYFLPNTVVLYVLTMLALLVFNRIHVLVLSLVRRLRPRKGPEQANS